MFQLPDANRANVKLEQMSLFAGLGEKTQAQPNNKFNWAEPVNGKASRAIYPDVPS